MANDQEEASPHRWSASQTSPTERGGNLKLEVLFGTIFTQEVGVRIFFSLRKCLEALSPHSADRLPVVRAHIWGSASTGP